MADDKLKTGPESPVQDHSGGGPVGDAQAVTKTPVPEEVEGPAAGTGPAPQPEQSVIPGKGLSDSMVRGLHATCRSALEKAVQEGLLRTNPAVGCKLPPKRGREMQVLGREELQRFLIQAQAEGCYELFLLDLCTGLRRGELLALQWDDLDFKTGALTVNKQVYEVRGQLQVSIPKTRASIRKLVLPPGVVEVLRQ